MSVSNESRNAARAAFAASPLSRRPLTREDMQKLRNCIDLEMERSDLMRGTFRCKQRPTCRGRYEDGGWRILCRSFYFENREAVTFNSGGFVGFAGWADDENIKPILAGFLAWLKEGEQ